MDDSQIQPATNDYIRIVGTSTCLTAVAAEAGPALALTRRRKSLVIAVVEARHARTLVCERGKIVKLAENCTPLDNFLVTPMKGLAYQLHSYHRCNRQCTCTRIRQSRPKGLRHFDS